jgi:putative transposase
MSELASKIGVKSACEVLNVPRSRVYRERQPKTEAKPRPTPAHALSDAERGKVRKLLNSERFMDQPPRQVYATLLDEGIYVCHWRTMYRILHLHNEVRERRLLRRHPTYKKPELLAERPNEVWSWDITHLRGAVKWSGYKLYTVLDIFSRYVVGWMIAEVESSELAKQLIAETVRKQGIPPEQLTLHADNGSPMTGQPLSQLLVDLGITKSHSRPQNAPRYSPGPSPGRP